MQQVPISGIAGHDPSPVARVTPGQAAILMNVISHAADCGLPLPTEDFMFPESDASMVLPVATVEEVTAWCRAFQDDDQHAAVLTDKIDRLTTWWTGGLFLDVPVIVRAERLEPAVTSPIAMVPLLSNEALIERGLA